MKKPVFHFFGTSVAEFHVDSDIKRLIKFMDKQGFEYGLWYVPVDINKAYEVMSYAPQVDGSVFLGKYQVK
jgi:hypothetical protein